MAASLSLSLKLPGKKLASLGEYDPLCQDSDEDEASEEDDLVLNYPRNGLSPPPNQRSRGEGNEPQKLREETGLQEEVELEEEEAGLGRSQCTGEKGASVVQGAGLVRTAAFLLPLSCAMLLVLLCAFLITCPEGAAEHEHWERALGDGNGVASPPLTLWDVDGDGFDDVLIGVTSVSNNSQPISRQSKDGWSQELRVFCGVSARPLWSRSLREPLLSVRCGFLSLSDGHGTCLLIGSGHVIALNASSGRTLWAAALREVQSGALLLPDLDADGSSELLLLTLPEDQVSDLSLVLLSGRSGALIGRPVTFNLTAQGKLIGPLLQRTLPGEYYVLFGLGAVEAVSLRSLVALATPGFTPEPIRVKERSWEVLKKSNSSSLLHISSEQVDLLLPLLGGGCPALDLNCSGSMFLLLCGAHGASLLRARDLQTVWSLDRGAPHSRPALGHFNDDGVPDLLLHQAANGVRKVQIIDGASGRSLWEMAFVCPRLAVQDWSVLTTSGQSVFLFWAGDPLTNDTKATVPLVRKLFLLHPSYPRILLELRSTTDTVLTAEVSAASPQKDVSYVTVSSRSSAADIPLTHFLTSFRLKDSIASARLTRTHGREEEEDEDSLGLYRRLSFTQVCLILTFRRFLTNTLSLSLSFFEQ